MTQHLIVLGDSLADSGNTASVLQLIGQNPFEDDIYDKGGNVKASDGPVLGEFVAIEMGAKIDDAQLISAISSEGPKDVQVHNYAHSGASTDASPGFSLPTGEFVGMGLKEQKKLELFHHFEFAYVEYQVLPVLQQLFLQAMCSFQ